MRVGLSLELVVPRKSLICIDLFPSIEPNLRSSFTLEKTALGVSR